MGKLEKLKYFFLKKKEKPEFECRLVPALGNLTIILTLYKDCAELVGFTICQDKHLEKVKGWEHLLFRLDELEKFLEGIGSNYAEDYTSFLECDCRSEILRYMGDFYSKDGSYSAVLDVFDNYWMSRVYKVEDSCELSQDGIELFVRSARELISIARKE